MRRHQLEAPWSKTRSEESGVAEQSTATSGQRPGLMKTVLLAPDAGGAR